MHDGPGIRTTVFLKGCPLHCAWCHNPETQKAAKELLFYPTKCIGCQACASVCAENAHILVPRHEIERTLCTACEKCTDECPTCALQMCGKEYTIAEILSEVEKDRAFYGESGGITLSGGEPLMQGTATVELLKECKARGFSTAVETCGYVSKDTLLEAIPYTDLFLWDIKDTNDARHKRFTGVSNQKILENLTTASAHGAKIRLRCILINGINTEDAHYAKIAKIASSISRYDGAELIPYHAFGAEKSVFLGKSESGNKEWIPTAEEMERARHSLTDLGIRVI